MAKYKLTLNFEWDLNSRKNYISTEGGERMGGKGFDDQGCFSTGNLPLKNALSLVNELC